MARRKIGRPSRQTQYGKRLKSLDFMYDNEALAPYTIDVEESLEDLTILEAIIVLAQVFHDMVVGIDGQDAWLKALVGFLSDGEGHLTKKRPGIYRVVEED